MKMNTQLCSDDSSLCSIGELHLFFCSVKQTVKTLQFCPLPNAFFLFLAIYLDQKMEHEDPKVLIKEHS